MKILAITDSDSYVKWGAALLARTPDDWERSLVVLASPVLPSADQLEAALAGIDDRGPAPVILDLSALAVRIASLQPDAVLIAVRGPLVKVIVRAILGAAAKRPVIVTGLPGISIPASKVAISHRAQADLFVLHSRREVREFSVLAAELGVEQRFALATLPFLGSANHRVQAGNGDIVFAAQAKVPERKQDRVALLGWLAETARRHPARRVLIKVRAATGEAQTHAERHDFASLLGELSPPPPANLLVTGGAMSSRLREAGALVTVSSTAAIEAVALGVPVLALDDFGVSAELINPVFENSGLFGSSQDLVTGRFNMPAPEWTADNYFHGLEEDDWVNGLEAMLALRAEGRLLLKPQRRGTLGGKIRRAWDRKRALGRFDRSYAGYLALAIGLPPYFALRSFRRLRNAISPRPSV